MLIVPELFFTITLILLIFFRNQNRKDIYFITPNDTTEEKRQKRIEKQQK